MHTLVLLRHGQSAWNLENRFTGWTDVGLTDQGKAEAEPRQGIGLVESDGFPEGFFRPVDVDLHQVRVAQHGLRSRQVRVHSGGLRGGVQCPVRVAPGQPQLGNPRLDEAVRGIEPGGLLHA
jgi:hypothetical protein